MHCLQCTKLCNGILHVWQIVDMKTGRGENLYSTYSSSSYMFGDGVEAFDEEADVEQAFFDWVGDDTRLLGFGGMIGLTDDTVVVLVLGGGDLLPVVLAEEDFSLASDLAAATGFLLSGFGEAILSFDDGTTGIGEPCFIGISRFGDAALAFGVTSCEDICFKICVVGCDETIFSLEFPVFGIAPVSFEIGSFLTVVGAILGAADEALTRTFPATAPGFVPVLIFGSKISISCTSFVGTGSNFCCADFAGSSFVLASTVSLNCFRLISFLVRLLFVGLPFLGAFADSAEMVVSLSASSTCFLLL